MKSVRSEFALACAWVVAALAPAWVLANEPSVRFARLSVEDGLSQSSVEHIVQDRYGFLWFGTQEGLNRYDGYHFVVHRASDEPGFLAHGNITALIEDSRQSLGVGTEAGLRTLRSRRVDVGKLGPRPHGGRLRPTLVP